jgi:Uncharacterized protein conserved in bacteria (DUF2252)
MAASLLAACLIALEKAMVLSTKKTTADAASSVSPVTANASAPIVSATERYERWLRKRIDVVESDLRLKHADMAASLFSFLRATFYRWASLWPEVCPDLLEAPRVLAIGDLHVENFGTWRDAEGRLVWGVNDFDEVASMPYTIDLVRLVTSAILAKNDNGLAIDASAAATAVIEGYLESLEAGGQPFILEESHPGLREMALGAERDPTHFWLKITELASATPPKRIQRLLTRSLPDGAADIAFSARIAGVGSLGRPRYVASARCNGGLAAREAKAWLPSAWTWAEGRPKERPLSVRLLKHAVRQQDPYHAFEDGWIIRRIGPHCGRIELAQFPKRRDEKLILRDMGRETANLHLASRDKRKNVLRDLAGRKPEWLLTAAQAMSTATEQDWNSFRAEVKP